MSACRKRLSFLAFALLLTGTRHTLASHSVTLPFRAMGVPLSVTARPDGKIQIIAQGRATHLGLYTAFAVITNIPQGPGEPPKFEGVITMVAANGDQLDFHYFGVTTQILPIREGEGTYEITGGTGRFAEASGQGAFASHNNMTVFDGTINLSRGK